MPTRSTRDEDARSIERGPDPTRRDRRRRRMRVVRVTALVIAIVLVGGTGAVAAEVARLANTVSSNAIDISNGEAPKSQVLRARGARAAADVPAMDGAFTVLLVGADNAAGQTGFGARRTATLNDVDILVHVNTDHTSGTVISLPRDLVIDQPRCAEAASGRTSAPVSHAPLNVAYSRGGLGCVVATVASLTGLDIPYAALFSFRGTVAMADAVGGVPVCLNKAIDDPASGLKLPRGTSTITGRTALAYLRSRHGVGDGSDLARISSQQAYMSALARKLTSSSTLTDPAALDRLASVAAEEVRLSTSLADLRTMVTMLVALKTIDLQQLVFVQYPTRADPADRNKVVPDTALASTLLERVRRNEALVLADGSTGRGAELQPSGTSTPADAPPTSKSTTSPEPTSTAKPIRGLSGQTAAQRTCTVAFGH